MCPKHVEEHNYRNKIVCMKLESEVNYHINIIHTSTPLSSKQSLSFSSSTEKFYDEEIYNYTNNLSQRSIKHSKGFIHETNFI